MYNKKITFKTTTKQTAPVQTAPVVPVASRYETEERQTFTPFAFGFDNEDEYQTKIGRKESADEFGTVTGEYTLSDASGIARIVKYVAGEWIW